MFSSQSSQVSSTAAANYIEDVFSTYLYTGTGSAQTITNNIDLSTKGGLVWFKARNSSGSDHALVDSTRGLTKFLATNSTLEEQTSSNQVTSFNTTGFTLGTGNIGNQNSNLFSSWTFRKQPKFFDIVTYTGNPANASQTISHNLGSVPGCIIVKCLNDSTYNWAVYHRSSAKAGFTAAQSVLKLNLTNAVTDDNAWGNTAPTATEFTVGPNVMTNGSSGQTYVAYLFAHDAGGFGLTGTDNVISCGSYTGNASTTGPIVTLGYEPQFVMVKAVSAGTAGNWTMMDSMRTLNETGYAYLRANTTATEVTGSTAFFRPLATGFQPLSATDGDTNNPSGTVYIYIAIRRGPMKTPTSGTSVFQPVAYTGTNVDNRLVNTGIVTDMTMARIRTSSSTGGFYTADRLRGNAFLGTAQTNAEATDADSFMTPTSGYGNSFSAMNGFGVGNDVTRQLNQSSTSQLAYAFQRAPKFFDVVCYAGNGSTQNVSHNLGVAPEMMIVKIRSTTTSWQVYHSGLTDPPNYYILLDSTSKEVSNSTRWNATAPTSTVFSLGNTSATNGASGTYVAYLFASLAGISKVGRYTGTGTTQTINCGFSGGARFVLIKRTDVAAYWYVWDTARGMVAGTDPWLLINASDVENNADTVYTATGGFQIVASPTGDVNTNGGTYIYLAIA